MRNEKGNTFLFVLGAMLFMLMGAMFLASLQERGLVGIPKSDSIDFVIPGATELFVSYQGWLDDNRFVNTWSGLVYNKALDGEGMKEIAEFLKKENGFQKVIFYNFQRFEK